MQPHSILRITYWGTWRNVVGFVSPDVSNERSTFVFQGCEINCLNPSQWQHYGPSKRREIPTTQQGTTAHTPAVSTVRITSLFTATRLPQWHRGSEQLLPTLRCYAAAFVCGIGTFVVLAILMLEESPTHRATSVGGESTGNTTLCLYRGPETLKASTQSCTMPTGASCFDYPYRKFMTKLTACIWSTVTKQEAGYKTEIGREFH